MRTLLTGLVTFGACRAARRYLDRENRKDTELAGGHVQLTKLWNKDAAFGLKIPRSVVLTVSCAASVAAWFTRRRSPLGTGLLLGGGLSNLAERLLYGKVYDYIRFPKAPGKLKQYVYNLADVAIFTGLLAWTLGRKR